MIHRLSILLVVVVALGTAHGQSSGDTSGTISGRVVSDSGQPLAGASLFVRAMNSAGVPRVTTTDAEGNFRLNNLEPALYTIVASAPAYAVDTAAPTYYRLGDSVSLEMIRGGVLTGTVTNASGDPVIGVRVRAVRVRDAAGKISRTGTREQTTDDRGVYRIYGLLPGSYLVSAGGGNGFTSSLFNPYDNDVPTYAPSSTRDDASEINVGSGDEITADIRYRGESGHTISGTVKLAGTSGATVSLRAVGNPVLLANAYQPAGRGFAFTGLADGEYTLRASEFTSDLGPNAAQGRMATKRVTIKGASVSGLELVTTPMASISGRVVLEPSKAPECQGKRSPLLAETLVQLQRPEKEVEDEDGIYLGLIGGVATPDASGALVWRNVNPGRYRFEPRFYARYWYLKSITVKQKIDAAANWTVTKAGEQVTGVTITLAQGAASIRGRVQSGTIFYLIPAEPDKATDVLRFFATDVASDGTFALNNLPPGKYFALTQANADVTQSKLREPETEAAAARAKLRRAAEAKKTEIELKPCQNLADYQLKQ